MESKITLPWIPCKERLPENGDDVLCCGAKGGIYIASYGGGGYAYGWWKRNANKHSCHPIAWCPMPEIYRETTKDGE